MEKYLSIGEVVKMKGVSHRSLRHYDEIGILKPAYVNTETGYRYYTKSQMIILDVITLCVAFGIPLKQFKSYMQPCKSAECSADFSINLKRIVDDAQRKALEAQKEMEQRVYFLNSVAEHFAESQKGIQAGHSYSKDIAERFFLVRPAPSSSSHAIGNWQEYLSNMTQLYALAEKNDLSMSVNQGFCSLLKGGAVEAHYFLEVKAQHTCAAPHMIIPKARFICEVFEETDLFAAFDKYTFHEYYRAGSILIFNDILEHEISHRPVPFEVQLMYL